MKSKIFVPLSSFGEMARKRIGKEYFTLLAKNLNMLLKRYYGELGSQQILKLLTNRRLVIINPETFTAEVEEDTSIIRNAYKRASNVEEFFTKAIYNIKRVQSKGASRIELSDFLLALSEILAENKKDSASVNILMNSFIMCLATISKEKNPIVFRILDKKLLSIIKKEEDLDLDKYYSALRSLINAYDNAKQVSSGFSLPKLEVLHAVYKDAEWAQKNYISNLFSDVPFSFIRETFEGVSPTSKEELGVAIDITNNKSKFRGIDKESVLLELDRIQREYPYKTYSINHDLTDILKSNGVPRAKSKMYKMEHLFIDYDTFKGCKVPVSAEIRVDCLGMDEEDIDKILDFVRYAGALGNAKPIKVQDVRGIKITLINVKVIGTEFSKALNLVREELKSKFNKEVILEVQYLKDIAEQKAGVQPPKYIRVIGDIHEEVNRGRYYQFNFGDDFVLSCGDISGDIETTRGWTLGHMRRGVIVEGNHFGYDQPYPELNGNQNRTEWKSPVHISNTRNTQTKILSKVLALNEEIKFLERNMWKYNGVTFVGTCLFTNYKLLGANRAKECMKIARDQMNDFRKTYVYKEVVFTEPSEDFSKTLALYDKQIRLVTPEDYYHYFAKNFRYLQEVIPLLKKEKVVVITHHAPLPQSLNPAYKDDPLSASFASDLSEFIKENPQIRLWCHGHTHYPVDYIFGETRIISCPFGYYNENNYELPYNYGVQVPFSSVRSSKSWRKILKDKINEGLIKVYD